MDILGQSALILAVTAFSLAVTALSRNLRNKLVRSFSVLCAVISLWSLAFFLEKIVGDGTFYRAQLGFNVLLPTAGIAFIRVLTRVETRFSNWLLNISVFYSGVVLILQWSRFYSTQVVQNLSFFAPLLLVIHCFYSVTKPVKSVNNPAGVHPWVFIGALIILFTATMDYIPWMGELVPSIGNILLGIYLFMISEAIIQQRLLNLEALVSRILVIGFVSSTLAFIFLALTVWVDASTELYVLNSFLAAFIILMLIDPIQKGVNFGVMRLVVPRYLKFKRRVIKAQHDLTGILDSQNLGHLSIELLKDVMPFESATVFVLRSDGTKFKRICGEGDDQLESREILATHPMVEFFIRMRRRSDIPIVLDTYLENEIERATNQSQRQLYDVVLKGLSALNSNIAIPFMDLGSGEHETLGFVVMKISRPPEPWGGSWGVLGVIYPFFQQAAQLLKNMDVYKRLREKERLAALGEMSAGLAHEIRNPLGAIKGAAQYLQAHTSQLNSELSPFFTVIVEETNRLNRVVTDFLDYSKPYSASFVETKVGVILEKTHALFQGYLKNEKQKKLNLDLVEPDGGFGNLPSVSCSPEQLKQVLVNLVQNSIQAYDRVGPDSSGRIQMGARISSVDRGKKKEVEIFVEDDGPGIEREHLDKLFIPFFTTSPGGTGLGLAICGRIVEAHGGRIDAVSEKGKSTRFSVHLPLGEGNA